MRQDSKWAQCFASSKILFLLKLECRAVFADDWNKLKPLKMTSHPLQDQGTWPGKRLECNTKSQPHPIIRFATKPLLKPRFCPASKSAIREYTTSLLKRRDKIVRSLGFLKNIPLIVIHLFGNYINKCSKGKGKVHTRISHERSEGE
jgi:hypothetical protein